MTNKKPDNKPSKRKIYYINGKPEVKRKESMQDTLDRIGYKSEPEFGTDDYVSFLGQ